MSGESGDPEGGGDGTPDFHDLDPRSPTSAVVASLAAAAVAATALALASPVGGAVLGAAAVGLLAGSLRASTRTLTRAAAVGVVALGVAGYRGASAEALLVAGVGLAVAWDVADHGVELGAQVGRGAPSRRNVAVHAGASLLVGAVTAGVAYGVARAAGDGRPVAALALLLFGGVALVSALR